jgi:RNA 2',3'-cyclic 3'-phosphodiesterase
MLRLAGQKEEIEGGFHTGAFRAFIAVELDGNFNVDSVLAELSQYKGDLSCVRRENMHMTLKFLGDTDEGMADAIEDVMKKSGENIPPFEVDFRGVGAFPERGAPNVVWAGVEGAEPLAELARRLENLLAPLGFPREGRFSPHITLARVKNPRTRAPLGAFLANHAGDRFGRMRVDALALKKSVLGPAGPLYSTVRKAPLR